MEWYWWVYGAWMLVILYLMNKQLPIWVTGAWAIPMFIGPWKFMQPEAVSAPWWIIIGAPIALSLLNGFIKEKIRSSDDS